MKFDAEGKSLLIGVLDHWMNEVGKSSLPEGIFDLRIALINDRDRDELASGEDPPPSLTETD